MIRFCLAILSTPLSTSNLCSVYLLSNVSYGMVGSFFIHLSVLQYEIFLVIGFINKLDRNLLILYFVVFDSTK